MFGVEEKKENKFLPLNLQFFAKDADNDDDDVKDGENDDDQKDQDGAGSEDDKDGKDTKGSDSKDDKSKGKTFTQDQVTRMMTREKNQGRNAVLKELGIDPKDKKAVAMVKAIIESQKTDEQKDAEKQSAENEALLEAERRALQAEAKAEAMLLGVKTQYVEDVVALALSKMTEDSDLKTLIGEYKTKYPIWFGESEDSDDEDAKKKKGQKGTGSSIKTSQKDTKGNENKSLGARLAAQRKGTTKKSSYWS